MKIGLVLPSTPGYSETFFTNKIKGLEAQGHTVVLFVNSNVGLPENKNQLPYKIKIAPRLSGKWVFVTSAVRLFRSLFFHFKKTKRLYQLNRNDGMTRTSNLKNIVINSYILSEKLDWLHFGFGTMALGRENVAQAINAKMAVSFRGYDHYVYPVKNQNCYKTLFSKDVKYHVLSEGMKQSLLQNGISASQIVKITPAIDHNLFQETSKTKQNSNLQMVTIARLHWVKGLEYTLEALALFKQKEIPFHYTIVGDGIEKERLQFAVHQLGLTNDVTFVGKLQPESVKEMLKSIDVYIQYSIQEGFCNSVLEAQAMGKLCIVSDADGLTENVIDGVTGFVVPKRNPVSLAEKLFEVSKKPSSEKETMIRRAIERIKLEFAIEEQIKEFIRFYNLLNK